MNYTFTFARGWLLCLLVLSGSLNAQPLDTRLPDAAVEHATEHALEHVDSVHVDPGLSLPQLLEQTLEQYPERLINEALQQRAAAWQQRGDSFLAGSTALALNYSDDRIAQNDGRRDAHAQLEFTLWNWGQRSAAQDMANQALRSADKQSQAVKLEVAYLLRSALWDMALTQAQAEQAEQNQQIAEQWRNKVKLRVDAGDLARSDLLLVESDYLQSRSLYLQAQAEMMHARKAYQSLTQTDRIPAQYQENLSNLAEIPEQHPLLEAANALIASKQAGIEWAKTTDTINQPKLNIGGGTSRDARGTSDIQSAGVGVVIPFGHSTYDAPEIANAHLELNQALAQREHLQRQLQKALHEAEHLLSVTRAELVLAQQRRDLAEKQLKMAEISFSAGEISLLDVLKIKASSLESIGYAKQQTVKLQREIALYNQAVGVLP